MNTNELIKKHREEKGFTQEQLAESLNMTKATISRYESGKRTPKVEQLKKISKVLGISIMELISSQKLLEKSSSETYELDFNKLYTFLSDYGYEPLPYFTTDGIEHVCISSEEEGTVTEMLMSDFIAYGNDMIQAIEDYKKTQVQEFLKKYS